MSVEKIEGIVCCIRESEKKEGRKEGRGSLLLNMMKECKKGGRIIYRIRENEGSEEIRRKFFVSMIVVKECTKGEEIVYCIREREGRGMKEGRVFFFFN